jgi:[acyl-carrier-protein] S-malonyltransferase/trans-AT polyketide synthase/acyltransferase/oxidoreductase domain-containing protein
MSDGSSTVVVVFPGQGSQRPGMAIDFCDEFPVSRQAFEEASDALGLDVRAICAGDDGRLDLTEYTQPCIVTAEIAMFRALESELGLAPGRFGGHSLGEYTALCAAGVLPLASAVKLVRRRGALMQTAVPVGEGAMTAVIGADVAERDLAAELDGLEVDVANRNAPDQIVLSGPAAKMPTAAERVAASLGDALDKLVPLNVSAPFHSRMMRPIEPAFRAEL